jgi:hypothetical protein
MTERAVSAHRRAILRLGKGVPFLPNRVVHLHNLRALLGAGSRNRVGVLEQASTAPRIVAKSTRQTELTGASSTMHSAASKQFRPLVYAPCSLTAWLDVFSFLELGGTHAFTNASLFARAQRSMRRFRWKRRQWLSVRVARCSGRVHRWRQPLGCAFSRAWCLVLGRYDHNGRRRRRERRCRLHERIGSGFAALRCAEGSARQVPDVPCRSGTRGTHAARHLGRPAGAVW